jgi:hypothetical protein
MMRACRDLDPQIGIERFQQGMCPGAQSTGDQWERVVAHYIDDHPERLNENFYALAQEALRKIWPCQH